MKKVITTATLLSTVLSAPIISQKDDHLERVQRLMASNPLIDGHNDLPWQFYKQLGNKIEDIDLTVSQPRFHTDIPRLRKGQVGGQFWSVYVPCLTNYTTWSDDVMKTLQQIDVTKRMIELYPQDFELAVTAEQVKTAFQRGKIASLMGMEGGHSIDSSLGTLRMMYELGARYMTLTHNCHTPWADSATVDPIHGGLTNFGERVIFEMNRLGMLIDISHVSADTMRQVLRITRSPIIFSHSSAFSLCNHPRNVPDDVLRLTATNGGLVMVNFYSQFVCCDTVCSLTEVADHIEYIYKLVGADFVGVGGDYDGVSSLPVGLEDVSKYPNLFAELSRRGISESDLVKIMGGNLIRVLEQNERVAKELQGQTLPGEETIVQPRSCTPSSIAEDD